MSLAISVIVITSLSDIIIPKAKPSVKQFMPKELNILGKFFKFFYF
jgi:hypothetical protein